MSDEESGCHIHPYDRPRFIGEESFSGGFPHLHCRTCQNVLLKTIESLQAQLKRERALCDKLIEATEKDRCSHSIDPIYDRNVRDAIAAIHSEREKS